MTRKNFFILGSFIFICIVGVVLALALNVSHKEDEAIQILNEIYNEDFTAAQSTANHNPFDKNFTITVQSLNTNILYDFKVKDSEITGDYYAENVNVELNKLIEQRVDGLAMTNAHVEGLTDATSYKEADIEKIDVILITNETLTDEKAQEIAQLLKQETGEVAIHLDVLAVENEEFFNGVVEEVRAYFQLSTITVNSFEDFGYEHQQFSY